jgi:hypothetical protein
MPEVIGLAFKFSLFADHWHPRIVADLNHSQVTLVKLKGEFAATNTKMRTNSSGWSRVRCRSSFAIAI